MGLLQSRRLVGGFRRFSWYVTKCHACHGICTMSPLRAALTMRFAEKTRNKTRLKYCACHAKWHRRCPKCCACHEKCNTSSENVAKVLRLPQNDFLTHRETCWNVTKCQACHAKRHDHSFWHVKKVTFLRLFPSSRQLCAHHGRRRTVANGCGQLQTVANGCKRLQTVADARSRVTRTRVNPQTRKCKTRTLRYAFGKNKPIVSDVVVFIAFGRAGTSIHLFGDLVSLWLRMRRSKKNGSAIQC